MTAPARLWGRLRSSGFTLLEVLVAIAILGLGLTVILGSQVGLFSSASRGEKIGAATNLLRCKMSELEIKLLQQGYQLGDQHDEGPCCGDDDDSSDAYHCAWKIEMVKLPELPTGDGGLGAGMGDGGLDFGALGTFAGLGKPGASSPAPGAKPPSTGMGASDLAQTLSNAPSPAGLMPMMMSMVYPSLKPMLEASIRKLTVTVQYKEGSTPRELSASLYVTNPQQGQLDPFATDGGLGIPGLPGGGLSGAGGAPRPGGGLFGGVAR